MNNVINLSKEQKRRERKKLKELNLKVREEYRNSIWRDLVKEKGAIPQNMKDVVDRLIRAEEIKAFGEPPK